MEKSEKSRVMMKDRTDKEHEGYEETIELTFQTATMLLISTIKFIVRLTAF